MAARILLALDTPDIATASAQARAAGDAIDGIKLGLEFFVANGPAGVREVQAEGRPLFLDLKLHDIPNTVAGAIRSATHAGASLLTIHATGGAAMMSAAAEAASTPGSPRLLAVTVLTSMDANELTGIGITTSPAEQVLRLARLAQASGIDGMVCSPEEVAILRKETGSHTLLVIPGIRPTGSAVQGAFGDDQKRIATPAQAIRAGASMLVVGRPITRAQDPAAAARAILQEIEHAQTAAR
jgi:orotidine-5'-phosphate decarboxylase